MQDLVPSETEPKSLPYLFIGELPDQPFTSVSDYKYFYNYWKNIEFILAQGNFISVRFIINPNLNNLKREGAYDYRFSQFLEYTKETYFCGENERLSLHPQDFFQVTSNTLVINPEVKQYFDFTKLKQWQRVSENEKLAEGGKFVVGEELVFVGFNQEELTEDEKEFLANFFQNKKLFFVPTPKSLGVDDRFRHSRHIDQYIGGALRLNNNCLIVPIDQKYYEKTKDILPKKLENGLSITYFLVDCSSYYLLNYPLIDNSFYIGPELKKILENAGYWPQISSNIKVLPHELPVNDQFKAGMKCKLNFIP